MHRYRFYVPPLQIIDDIAKITNDEAHHLIFVLRSKVGDRIVFFDGISKEYEGIIEKIEKKEVRVRIVRVIRVEKAHRPRINLFQAIPKGRKLDFIVEKATELGADHIVPLITINTIFKTSLKNLNKKVERWTRVAISSSKQCGRIRVPTISEPVSFEKSLENRSRSAFSIITSGSEKAEPILKILGRFDKKSDEIDAFVGPEADFTEEEITKAQRAGAYLASLGKNILRTETAVIATLAIIQSYLESL